MIRDRKNGFTLSEVMITLGMIGVLAALTIPTLGTSIQQRARFSEFRTAWSKLETALQSITSDAGKVYACYAVPTSEQVSAFGLTLKGSPSSNTADCAALEKAFTKALGATRTCTSPVADGCIPPNYPVATSGCFTSFSGKAYILDNSMIMFTNSNSDSLTLFAVDVNGRKGPNKWGEDIFPFSVRVAGSVLSNGNTFVSGLTVLPPTEGSCKYISSNGKTTTQLLKQSAGAN